MPEKRYIQVILPLRLEWEPCYCLAGVDSPDGVRLGDRVKVLFAHKTYIAVVSAVDVQPDIAPEKISSVLEASTGLPPVSEQEIAFWRFLSDYYLCTIGEVYKAAYPAPKIKSEEVGVKAAERRARLQAAAEAQWKARIGRLQARLSAKDQALAKKHNESVTARLRAERAAVAAELEQARVRLAAIASGEIFDASAPPVIKAEHSRIWPMLSKDKPLLYKSSARMKEYLALAANCLAEGRGVLLLVPEIGLAKGLENLFREHFGNALLVHHSQETPARRRVISDRVRSREPYILLGTRSSIFLPFEGLGLVIVDGEQSPFYKQSDSAPRYNTRDAAVMLARIHGAKVLLGASSPSLESEFNAQSGRYYLLDDNSRSEAFELIDTAAEKRKRGMLGCISRKLAAECREGRIALIRGFEKQEEVEAALSEVFPGEEGRFGIFTVPEASKTDFSDFDLTAVLSADALFKADDFRSDERAFQFLDGLRLGCRRLIVQTRSPGHQVFSLQDAGALLQERKSFNMPPYTRLVDVLVPGGDGSASLSEGLSRRLVRRGFRAGDPMPRPDGRRLIRVTFRRERALQDKKRALYQDIASFCTERHFQGRIALDVDPS